MKPLIKEKVPLCRAAIGKSEIACVNQALRSGWLAHGPFNHLFEKEFAKKIRVNHAVTMNSCTSALEAALKVAKIRGEVVVPSFTWVATANAVVNTGGHPVFADVDAGTRNVTAANLEAKITSQTEAVIVVHFGGQPCRMDEIVRLCQRRKLLLIEDSAETLGATWNGKQAGSFGVGCFSFFPTKNITTGEGGMLTCADSRFASEVRALMAHGVPSTTYDRRKVKRPWLRDAVGAGHNYRLSNLLAALGYQQLLRLDSLNHRRRILAKRYDLEIAKIDPRIRLPFVHPQATHAYQMYTITVPARFRDRLVLEMRARGIGASVHFDPPVHRQSFYLGRKYSRGKLPVTERLGLEIVTLPIYPDMKSSQQDLVLKALREVWRRIANSRP